MSSNGLAQSTDKKELFAKLGLNEHIHKLLLSEAQAARDSMSVNPANLTEQSRGNPGVQAPYKWDEISETAKHMQILWIVRSARPDTAPYYHKGQYLTNVNEENWVARWYLWHSFRYRDNRPKPTTLGNEGYTGTFQRQKIYDPARGEWR